MLTLGRLFRRHTGRANRLRWVIALGVTVSLLVLVPLLWPQGPAGGSTTGTLGASGVLTTTKKIYATSEDPALRLSFPKQKVSWLLPGVGRAVAAEQVHTTVTYANGHTVNVPVKVTTEGNDNYKLQLAPKGAIKPGRYTVTATWGSGASKHEASQSFAWGVLAVNTGQDVYTPGQTVDIQMAALSSSGNTLCDAPLVVTVTDPNGQSAQPAVVQSGKCNGDNYVEAPDYTAQYQTGAVGTYQIEVRLSDSDYRITNTFSVQGAPNLVVTRTGPSRLYPYSPYKMAVQVTPRQAFQGDVVERLPQSFAVSDAGGAAVTKGGGYTQLTWHVNWQAGQTYQIGYTFKAPLVSPAFYYVQPLTLSQNSRAVYREGRSWQIASDAVITFVKETAGQATSNATISATSTSGNTLVLLVNPRVNNNTTYQSISVSDSTGTNSWSVPANTPGTPGTNPPYTWVGNAFTGFFMAYALNASAITTFTITMTSSVTVNYDLVEFSNVATSSAVDQSDSLSDTAVATAHSTPTVTTTTANDVIIGGIAGGASTTYTLNQAGSSPTSGYTALNTVGTSSNFLGSAYQIMTGTGSYKIAWTTGSQSAGLGIMAFMPAVTTGCTPTVDTEMRGGNYFCNGAEQGFFWAS